MVPCKPLGKDCLKPGGCLAGRQKPAAGAADEPLFAGLLLFEPPPALPFHRTASGYVLTAIDVYPGRG